MSVLIKQHFQLSSVMMIILSFLMTAVSFNAAEARDIWRVNGGLVKLIKADKGAVNEHPKSIGPRELYFALRAIKARKRPGAFKILNRLSKDSNKTGPIFTDREVKILVPHLIEGLRQAGGKQDVSFSLKQRRKSFAGSPLSSPRLVTSGRLFFSGGRLNIIFGSGLNDFDLKTGVLQRDARRFGTNSGKHFDQGPPGSRGSKSRLGVEIVTGDGVALSTFKGKKRDDWVQIASIDAIARSASIQAQPNQGGAPVGPPRPQLSVEQRLAKLKQLRQQGLITEDVYQQQTTRILNSSL